MALSRSKTWVSGEILTASDQNAEFNNILNNALSLISPLTGALDFNGNELILDSDADTSITADTDDRIDFRLSGADLFRMDGTATTPVNGLDWVASATGSAVQVQAVGSDTDITINLVSKGSGTIQTNGTDIGGGQPARRADMALFKASTVRAMAMNIADNVALNTQVFY